jgi:hypothetical protein
LLFDVIAADSQVSFSLNVRTMVRVRKWERFQYINDYTHQQV